MQTDEHAQILIEDWQRFAIAALQSGASPSKAAQAADRLVEETILRRGVLLATETPSPKE